MQIFAFQRIEHVSNPISRSPKKMPKHFSLVLTMPLKRLLEVFQSMKVLLATPPYERERAEKKEVKNLESVLPPLGLLYVAAILERDNHEVKVIDGIAQSIVNKYTIEELHKEIQKYNPDVLGLSIVSSLMTQGQKVLEMTKENNPAAITIVGGPFISAAPHRFNTIKNADYAVVGEAEMIISNLLKRLETHQDPKDVPGLVYVHNNTVHVNPDQPIDDLDILPMPARHLVNMSIYRPSPGNFRRLPATQMMTSRGCPYRCTFCSRSTVKLRFRAHSAQRVLEEIEMLIRDFGIRDIQFFDDTFTLIPKRVEEICKGIIERKLDVTWHCMTRADRATPDLYKLMKKAGCYEVGFGIESGSQRILNFIKKDITLEQVRKGVEHAKEAGLDVRGFFILGHLTETKEEAKATIKFANSLPIDIAQYMIATPYPGTELWNQVKELKGDAFNEEELLNLTFFTPENAPLASDMLTQEEINKLYHEAYRSFYIRPSYILKHLRKIKSIADIKRYYRATKGIFGG